MIHRLWVANFHAFKERQELDFSIARNVGDPDNRFASPLDDRDLRLPRVVTVLGANGAGKSALLRVITFLRWFLVRSYDPESPEDDPLPYVPFADTEGASTPTVLGIDFTGRLTPEVPPCPCRYEVWLAPEGDNSSRVVRYEALHHAPEGRFRRLFERHGRTVTPGREMGVTPHDRRLEAIRPKAGTVATLSALADPVARAMAEQSEHTMQNTFLERPDQMDEEAAKLYQEFPGVLEKFNESMGLVDGTLSRVTVSDGGGGPETFFHHQGLEVPVALVHESRGTRNFFRLFPFLFVVRRTGGVAVFDDLDGEVDPTILPRLLDWLRDPRTNPRDGQLFLAAHTPALLKDLVKEEVVVVTKDAHGRASATPLKDVRGIRRDRSLHAQYLRGVIPGLEPPAD